MKKITMFSFLVFVSFVSACTSVGFQKTEDTLSAAGFQMKIADTPKKMALLKSMTQNKIIIHPKNGTNYYIYADAAGCQCIYGGKILIISSISSCELLKILPMSKRLLRR